MIPIRKKNIAVCILLSIFTFGIYDIFWLYSLTKNIRAIQNDTHSCVGEMLCLIFVPFYPFFWWYTRGERVKRSFREHDCEATGNGVVYLILAIFRLNIVSMAIMQSDFNALKSKIQPEQPNDNYLQPKSKIDKTHWLPATILSSIILVFAVLCIVLPKDDISESERRKLADFPKFTIESFMSGKFAKDFEEYATDNFPFRDAFRTIKSTVNYHLFNKSDNNDIYIYEDSMMKLEKEFDEKSAQNALSKFNSIYDQYIKDKTDKVYVSIVPDKAYFPWKNGDNIPSLDYNKLFDTVKEGMPYASYIDVTDNLELSDFYKTDSHWRQERIPDVAEKIASEMGYTLSEKYTEVDSGINFKGVYSGQAAKLGKGESLVYLISELLESCKVTNFENVKSDAGIYDMEKLNSRDPYEVFLSGACSAIAIENPNSESDRELVIFRDSYGSSIAPLLVENYSKVTLLDTRYMSPDFIGNYASFENADVLFIYSSTLINSSSALK